MDIEKKAGDIIYSILKYEEKVTRETITPEKSLIDDLGADSLALFEIVLACENHFDISVDIMEVRDRLLTVGNIIEFLKEETGKKVAAQ